MKKESILFGVIGLLAGIILTWGIAAIAVNNNYIGMMNMMGMHTNQGQMDNDHMSDQTAALQNKTGDEFDKLFLSEMITHHQNAIDMSNLAKARAKHEEVKDLAGDIMNAQSKEIDQMQSWQTEWGYKTTPQSHMMER